MTVSLKILWGVVVLYASMTVIDALRPNLIPVPVLVLFLLAFVLLHGALRYRWSGILIFIVIALVVSNVLENVSILTGFPFGRYYYTDALGPKLFLVPILIGLAYVGTGYLAWVIVTVLVGDVRRQSSTFTMFAVPVIASFVMVVWDLCFDPTFSTIAHRWIWEQGAGTLGSRSPTTSAGSSPSTSSISCSPSTCGFAPPVASQMRRCRSRFTSRPWPCTPCWG